MIPSDSIAEIFEILTPSREILAPPPIAAICPNCKGGQGRGGGYITNAGNQPTNIVNPTAYAAYEKNVH